MAIIDNLVVGKKLPFEEEYKEELDEIEFYNLSYKANGNEYTLGSSPEGYILPKFECEERVDWNNRRKLCPTRSYVSSIINKYNSSVFRNEPSRLTDNPTYQVIYEDADGYGQSLNQLMKTALKTAQIEGCAYLLADSTATDTVIQTIAQKEAANVRPYIRLIKRESVIAYEEIEEKLISALLILVDSEGNEFARYMDDTSFIDIKLGKEYKIEDISESYPHGYSAIPLVEIEPFEDAQSKPISYNQKTIINLLSLLQQEISDHTFTKHILSGVRIPEEDSPNKKVTYGSKRMIVLEDTNAKLDTIGSDVTQADSIRSQIKLEEENLYYSAGFGKNTLADISSNVSGYALEISREDFFITCSDLKLSIEVAENTIMSLIADKEGFDYIPAIYSNRFLADDNGAELGKLRDALALPLPNTFKKLLVKDYIAKFYNVSEEDMIIIERELLEESQ
jgi:hypothetical protein